MTLPNDPETSGGPGSRPAPGGTAPDAAPGGPGPAPARRTGLAGPLMMTGAALSNQAGAALATLAFPSLGVVGTVAVRQWVAAVMLLATVRPSLRSFTRAQWGPVLGLAAVFALMNLSLYGAVDRLGLGLAVTLEFTGPLAVALAGSRRALDLACAVPAAAAVVVLARPRPSADAAGIAMGLLAGACWASYILLNRVVGRRVPGVRGTAAAAGASAALYLPVGILLLAHRSPAPAALGCAAACGVLSSALPFALDLLALRRVPARYFGVFMSVHPVCAMLIGLLALHQRPAPLEVAAMAVVLVVNAVARRDG
jgi:inner membrane transporter RhtA